MADQPSDPRDTEYMEVQHLRADPTLTESPTALFRQRCKMATAVELRNIVEHETRLGRSERVTIAREVAEDRAIKLP